MGRGSYNRSRGQHVVPSSYKAMDQFKYEIANELGLSNGIQNGYWGNLSSRDCGAVGGEMVRRMIALAEQQLTQAGTIPATTGTTNNTTV